MERRGAELASMVGMFEESPVGIVAADALPAVVELARDHPEHEALVTRCLEHARPHQSAGVRSRAEGPTQALRTTIRVPVGTTTTSKSSTASASTGTRSRIETRPAMSWPSRTGR